MSIEPLFFSRPEVVTGSFLHVKFWFLNLLFGRRGDAGTWRTRTKMDKKRISSKIVIWREFLLKLNQNRHEDQEIYREEENGD